MLEATSKVMITATTILGFIFGFFMVTLYQFKVDGVCGFPHGGGLNYFQFLAST